MSQGVRLVVEPLPLWVSRILIVSSVGGVQILVLGVSVRFVICVARDAATGQIAV